MTLKQTIDYHKLNGKVFLGDDAPDDAILLFVNVEFEAEPQWENDGIGGYEFWGSREYDMGKNYVSLEQNGYPTWDKEKHTPDENDAIYLFTQSPDFDKLCDKFCTIYAKENRY